MKHLDLKIWQHPIRKLLFETLLSRAKIAIEKYNPKQMVLAGGVAANSCLRSKITDGLAKRIF